MSDPVAHVWAMDLASKAGMAEGDVGSLPSCYTVDHTGVDFFDTFGKFTSWLIERLGMDRPTHVVIEAPLPASALMNQARRGFGGANSNNQTFRVLYGLPALAVGLFRRADVRRVEEANIKTVRSYFIGHGNLPGAESKALVMQRCLELGLDPKDDNASDAAALFFWKCHQLDPIATERVCPSLQGKRYAPTQP